MKLTVVPSDNTIILNGRALVFPFTASSNLHAIQWNGTEGTTETTDAKQERFTDASVVQYFIDAFQSEATKRDTPPVKTVADAKTSKLAELKTAWNNTQNLGISTRGKTFAVGGQARAQLDRLLAAQANGITIPTTIRADDGTPIDFTAVTIKGLYDMMIKTERIAEDNYWAKRALVEAATTVAEVEAVTW